ncbi:hypothetical protein BN7_1591 [Wickerhamomyces ciferrii]|uniref:Uncharacterized protein n=1 Tax=Wickerhamomyces ciferrii (strain ATCC 14091 / BCRC 22168 / CBS 111 / JCM 3599 / NBRC 0793 / NRRL Y-1031 F-60-10) TaxID=1206466 RepID=K0KIP8_WICCF|nr:uncharacterized protein BN7_1591 [Wickerhamomyces ciferrii]CCH42052.1 hypothetical protein BN7_1591 [Wickerhamomyces ciferrii]
MASPYVFNNIEALSQVTREIIRPTLAQLNEIIEDMDPKEANTYPSQKNLDSLHRVLCGEYLHLLEDLFFIQNVSSNCLEYIHDIVTSITQAAFAHLELQVIPVVSEETTNLPKNTNTQSKSPHAKLPYTPISPFVQRLPYSANELEDIFGVPQAPYYPEIAVAERRHTKESKKIFVTKVRKRLAKAVKAVLRVKDWSEMERLDEEKLHWELFNDVSDHLVSKNEPNIKLDHHAILYDLIKRFSQFYMVRYRNHLEVIYPRP